MKYLFIKKFKDAPGCEMMPGDILELWSETAKRALKEKAAVEIPEGVDEEMFKESIFKKEK